MAEQSVVDGSKIRQLVTDEQAFSKFVDGKFESLDKSHEGALTTQELQPAVVEIGAALGLPPKGSSPDTDHIYDQLVKQFVGEKGENVKKHKFAVVMQDILLGLADGLEREPVKLMQLNGSMLSEYAKHADIELCAVSTFAELNSDGRVKASAIREAVKKLSVERGVPPYNEASKEVFDIAFNKVGIDEESYVDQIQFVEMLRNVLIQLASVLRERPLTVAHIEKQFDGKSLKSFLTDKNNVTKVIRGIWNSTPKARNGETTKSSLVYGLDQLAPVVDLPPIGAIEEIDNEVEESLKMIAHDDELLDEDKFERYMMQLLGSLMLQLEGKPVRLATTTVVQDEEQATTSAIF